MMQMVSQTLDRPVLSASGLAWWVPELERVKSKRGISKGGVGSHKHPYTIPTRHDSQHPHRAPREWLRWATSLGDSGTK